MNSKILVQFQFYIGLIFLIGSTQVIAQVTVNFAIIGDYGKASINELNVSQLIRSRSPQFIITVGDNNYELGEASTIDSNIGQYYHDFIHPYYGIFGPGAAENKFFPALGNHDWLTGGAQPYLDYFTLPSNERYYDYVKGNIHFFVVDSDPNEPDSTGINSVQAAWLQNRMLGAAERFKLVYFHHPPYSSGVHGNNLYMQWPFKQWGATAVFCGHDHDYERIVRDGLTYFIDGIGGKDFRQFPDTVEGSRIRFTNNFGALFVTAYSDSINFRFYCVGDTLIDDTTLAAPPIGIHQSGNILPEAFYLGQNYPNPFNPNTAISYSLPKKTFVTIAVYNSIGQQIEVLYNGNGDAGTHKVNWNASGYASGLYFYRISAGDPSTGSGHSFYETKKMLLIK